jgi:hypothetical protein
VAQAPPGVRLSGEAALLLQVICHSFNTLLFDLRGSTENVDMVVPIVDVPQSIVQSTRRVPCCRSGFGV